MGFYHARQVGAGITARWQGNSCLVVDVRHSMSTSPGRRSTGACPTE
jgi:hypothetical protein